MCLRCTLAMALSRCLTSAKWRLWLERMVLIESTSSCSVSPQVSSCCSRSSWFLCSMFSSSSSCLWAQLSHSTLPIGKSSTGLCSNGKHISVLSSFSKLTGWSLKKCIKKWSWGQRTFIEKQKDVSYKHLLDCEDELWMQTETFSFSRNSKHYMSKWVWNS